MIPCNERFAQGNLDLVFRQLEHLGKFMFY